ncbi:hypothetical protein JCGZ_09838 [Jatropha curcas]|uniref:Uncharacterized protein n=1 Tax=Jatropha curcas TaxID=180498 RepID=A0A067KMS6_JATCU|nr:hypothetical protein JCGZ_09838 [Jatropha curcas]
MAQEEEAQKCSNSNSGNIGRSSKKQKQKKVPQRGLGVAQLEKIRLEEQQKKDGSVILTSHPQPPISSNSPPNKPNSNHQPLPVIPNYNQTYSSSAIPYPCDISSPNSILRPQSIDIFNSNSLGWQSISVHQGHANIPKIWNSCDYNDLEKESCGVDPRLAFRSGLNLPFESTPIWPLPCLMQRAQYHHQQQPSPPPPPPPPPPSSMVNVSSSTSSSSSSLQNLFMELPSNQIYYGNYTPLWSEEEKMVGRKRRYPFSLDNPPGPSFHCKFPPIIGRSDESISFGNGSTFNFTSVSPNFREGPLCSDSISDRKHTSKKSMKEIGALNGDFLTLAPPSTTWTCPNSKLKHPKSAYLAFHNCESCDFDSLPYQGGIEDPTFQSGPSVPNQLQPYYSFLPPAVMQTGEATKNISNCNGSEVGETIDLNLKL